MQAKYRDFGPTLAAEYLAEKHRVEVSKETLRQWLMEAGRGKRGSDGRRNLHVSLPGLCGPDHGVSLELSSPLPMGFRLHTKCRLTSGENDRDCARPLASYPNPDAFERSLCYPDAATALDGVSWRKRPFTGT